VNEYRTPAEQAAQAEHEERVRAVLDQAVRDGGSMFAAMALGEPKGVVEMWIDRLWDGLRDNLSDDLPPAHPELTDRPDEDRLYAIVLLLTDRMNAEAEVVLRSICEVGE
jgi:hypothetical protein